MADPHYRHTQWGWVIIGSIVPLAAVILWTMSSLGPTSAPVIMFAVVMASVLVLFGSMTVVVDDERVQARMGIGFIRKTIKLSEVRHYEVVQSPWYYGWGIRFIPGGVLYNVSGLSSVEFILNDGKRVRIGSDEPELLEAAVRKVIGNPAPLTQQDLSLHRKVVGKGFVVAAVFTILVFGVVGTLMHFQSQPPEITIQPSGLGVKNLFYGGLYPWKDITEISLESHLPRILLRTNGYALGSTLRGHFRLDVLGDGELYIEAKHPPFIRVQFANTYLILNDENPDRTRDLFAQMQTQWMKARGTL